MQICGVGSRGGKDSGRLQARHFRLPILSTLSINDLVSFRRKDGEKELPEGHENSQDNGCGTYKHEQKSVERCDLETKG